MPMNNYNHFPCKQCGLCCRLVGKSIRTKHLALKDGTCRYLNKKTNLCSIYSSRPNVCRVDDYYDLKYKNIMSRDEFYSMNLKICKQLMEMVSKNGKEIWHI